MKTFFSTCLFALLGLFTISSCKKDSSSPDPAPPPTPVPGTVLTKVYILDTSLVAPKDTIQRVSFTYDTQDRLIVQNNIISNSGGAIYQYATRKFDYSGTSHLAYRKIMIDSVLTPPAFVHRDTVYYTFSAGKCSMDSVARGNYYSTSRYTYNPAYIKRDIVTRQGTPYVYTIGTANIFQTKVNNDITYQVDTTISNYTISGVPYTGTVERKITTSYLNNPNPIYSLYFSTHLEYLDDVLGIFSDQPPTNLILQQSLNLSSRTNSGPVNTFTSSISYTYQFRADGYATVARETFIENAVTTKLKYLFFYKP
jgi:hypothetical protein